MQRRHLLVAAVGLGADLTHAAGAPALAPPLPWAHRTLLGLGTTLTLHAAHRRAEQAERALDAAVGAIRAVEASMSLFRADSELARLNREGMLGAPSAPLLTVLRTAQDVARRSGGAFDATVQPLWTLHAQALRQGRRPGTAELRRVRGLVGWRGLDVGARQVRLLRPGMAVTLNGIAQGYAADAARDALRGHGVTHALIDTGEHTTLGRNDRGQAWTLGIEDPRDSRLLLAAVRLDGRAVATSADNRMTFTPDHRHHHIFDPATGDSPPELSSVTVLAPSAMLADALTKVMFVGGPRRIPALARRWQVGVLWVDKAGRWQATPDVHLA